MGDIISRAVGLLLFLAFVTPYILKIGSVPLTVVIVISTGLMIADAIADTRGGNSRH
jgi:hypothetical protein